MHVINLWGAPSSGKSTTAAGLFFLMKINKLRVELVTEYAKDLVWEDRTKVFEEQNKIFAEQNHRLFRLRDKVDFAISDSPLPVSVFYMPKGYLKNFKGMVFEQFLEYENTNFLLNRVGDFETFGRIHNENEALRICDELKNFMVNNNIKFEELDATPNTPNVIFEKIKQKLAHPQLNLEISSTGNQFNVITK